MKNLAIVLGVATSAGLAYALADKRLAPSFLHAPSLAIIGRQRFETIGAPGLEGKVSITIPGGPVAWSYDDAAACRELCAAKGIDIDSLIVLMQQESQCQPRAENPAGAVGLIQFIEATAKQLGTTQEALRAMGVREQLPYVGKYWDLVGFKPSWNLYDMYLAMFTGSAHKGASDGDTLYRKGEKAYTLNYKAFDPKETGVITVGAVRASIKKRYDLLAAKPRIVWE